MRKRKSQRLIASALTLSCLVALSAQASGGSMLVGRVVSSTGVSLDGVAVPGQETILAQDTLRVGKGGRALVSFSPTARAALARQTAVRFGKHSGHVVAQILSGTVAVEEASADGVMVETPKYAIRPQSGSKVEFLVELLPDRTTLVAAQHGEVAITEARSGQSYTLAEGLYAEIPPEASGVPAQETTGPQQTQPRGKSVKPPWHIGSLSHAASVGLVVAIAAGTAAAIAIPLAVSGPSASPSTP